MLEFNIICLLQFVLTWILVGLTWFVQLVHLPLCQKIKEGFVEYERFYLKRASLLVGPIMFLDAVSAIFLLHLAKKGINAHFATTNLILLIVIWLSIFIFQMGLHQKLSIRFSKKILEVLIAINWLRTTLTTIKGIVMLFLLYFILM